MPEPTAPALPSIHRTEVDGVPVLWSDAPGQATVEFVRLLGARVTVFHQGSILVEGPSSTVLNDARVREVYLGNRAR